MGFYSAKKEEWTKTNVCESCAIYGLDGSLWAASPKWKGLSEYDHTQEGLGEEATVVKVNEFKILEAVSQGNRNPSAAGARLCKEKFLLTTHDEGVSMLTKTGGGGGTVARTGKAIVVGFWDKEALMSNKLNQNSGDVAINVERIAKFMKLAGF